LFNNLKTELMNTKSTAPMPPKPKPMEPAYFIEYLSKADLTAKMFEDIEAAINVYNETCAVAADQLDSALEKITGVKIE